MITKKICFLYSVEPQWMNSQKANSLWDENRIYCSVFLRLDRLRSVGLIVEIDLFSIDQHVSRTQGLQIQVFLNSLVFSITLLVHLVKIFLNTSKTNTQIQIKCVLISNIPIHKNMTLQLTTYVSRGENYRYHVEQLGAQS